MVNQRLRKPTYLYVIGEPGSTTVKIGMTIDPTERLQQIQRMSPLKIEVLWARPASYSLERALHRHFAAQRSHGEWFTFEADPVTLIQAAIEGDLEEAATEIVPNTEAERPEQGNLEIPLRERLILEGLRRSFGSVWFSVQEAADQLRFMDTSMRDGLEQLADLGKVARGPERLIWRERQYALVVGSRA